MKKSLFFALLVCTVTAHGMDFFDIEKEQEKEARRLFETVKYALSLDWCEAPLNRLHDGLGSQNLEETYKKMGLDCGPSTAQIVPPVCLASVCCCTAVMCLKCPCVAVCECISCALVVRKVNAIHTKLLNKYGLSKKTE